MQSRPRPRLTHQPAGQTRQHRRNILLALLVLLLLLLGGFLWWRSQQPGVRTSKGPRERPVAEYVVTEKPTPMRQDLRLPKDYGKLPLEDKPEPPKPPTPGQPQAAKPPPARPGRWMPPPPPPAPQGVPPPPGAPQVVLSPMPGTPARPSFPVQRTSAPKPPTGQRWFGPAAPIQGGLLKAPFPDDPDATPPSKLFPKAHWERPAKPELVLYADQLINGLLMQDVHTDAPGTIRVKVTQDVVNRWGTGTVLLPLDSVILATMEGQLRYGQKRVPMQVYMGILPDGSAIQFQKSQLGDAGGASGLPVDVNNHYGALIAAAGIQAILNIGTRMVAGNTTGFNPTVEQEFAQDVARSINRTGNQIVQRELQRSPTGEQDYGFPVTVQFSENISFQSQPTIATK